MIALVPGCGNGLIEGTEECDTDELVGASCQTKGFASGNLTCTSSCLYNVTACTRGGSSSGGGGGSSRSADRTQLVITGRAIPFGLITVVANTQLSATGTADAQANFQIAMTGFAAGSHQFNVYVTDANGVRSASVAFTAKLVKGAVSKYENLLIAPILRIDKIAVKKDERIIFSGQSQPGAQIFISIGDLTLTTTTALSGIFSYSLEATRLPFGAYVVTAQSVFKAQRSPYSTPRTFTVGTESVFAPSPRCPQKGDLNDDCRVNLIDFSILAFWFDKPLAPAVIIREKAQLSGDGKINLVDFSIMSFYWTG